MRNARLIIICPPYPATGAVMKQFRYGVLAACLLFGIANPASARVDVSINLSLFPDLVPLPGYPVYYAPSVDANFFFYDGMYWLYEDDNWYTSDWYNGPWEYVYPEDVPVFVLRIPVRYYRRPPPYFRGWYVDGPPRWGYHWGPNWERRRAGWDRWDHRHIPAPAPLPSYQRNYYGDHYPGHERQREIRDNNYPHRSQTREPRERDQDRERERDRDRDRDRNHDHDRDRDQGSSQSIDRGPQQRDYQRPQPNANRPDDIERYRPQNERNQPSQQSPHNRPDASADSERNFQRRGPAEREPIEKAPAEKAPAERRPDHDARQPPREMQHRGAAQNNDRTPEPRQDRGQGLGRDRDQ
jgi:hypothetical protein